MERLLHTLINKEEWLAELGMTTYSHEQQEQLWRLVMQAVQTTALDALLDRLSQPDQRQLIQYLSEEDVSSELQPFLTARIPDYEQLLQHKLLEYRKQLQRDLSRLVRTGPDE